MMPEQTFTIGFTGKSARQFFNLIKDSGVKRVMDVRLNNSSQLAAFAKKDDLAYFLKEIADVEYVHVPLLAPTADILDAYKKHGGAWKVYEDKFMDLMAKREIEKHISPELLKGGCLLCSEHKPHQCHRRLVTEYLQQKWGKFGVRHLF